MLAVDPDAFDQWLGKSSHLLDQHDFEIDSVMPPRADSDRSDSRRLRDYGYRPDIFDNLFLEGLFILCLAGMVCLPGTVAQMRPDGTMEFLGVVIPCPDGIVCQPGTMTMRAYDLIAAGGQYVSPDGTRVLPCPPGAFCPGGFAAALPLECPPGQYQLTPGALTCSTCTAGTQCPGFGGALPELCPEGQVCSMPGRSESVFLCPAGSYCQRGTFTLNTLADFDGKPLLCSNATVCLPGSTTGTYDPDNNDPRAAKSCTAGTFCGRNTSSIAGISACPAGRYCPTGTSSPPPTPPGHYTPQDGMIYPEKCPPGYYASGWLNSFCPPCPAGYQCQKDGTVTPEICGVGTYRDATVSKDNLNCKPCPQGTWSNKVGLKSETECMPCSARYVCPVEGMTVFAEYDDKCESGGSQDICYENSQGYDCPGGYSCDAETTYYTQYDNLIEPGYWGSVRTAPHEARNLLCPEGYYCGQGTAQNTRKQFSCPAGTFCPTGTASVTVAGEVEFYNVQSSWLHVQVVLEDTGSACKKCPDDPAESGWRAELFANYIADGS